MGDDSHDHDEDDDCISIHLVLYLILYGSSWQGETGPQ